MGQLLVLVDDSCVVHPPADPIPDWARCLRVHGKPPEFWIGAEDLLPVPPAPNVEFALSALLTLKVFDRRVVFKH
eukprot:CAMPEP_0195036668 /NCGR_PEP_ID=MMETSP0326_2-20130528/73114_1 /TAXON_ID=2866 ORGANISM="Crypthecodinium cohnii, Strain Seligo" /NCGR_SAMPLE_ID=MMETSP0326_2 /ASSEMBLY_ACC=CAM_ASM_000348 /LENGTH=74 /DNA_ID=CAMNT_0040062361 /DNA_START=166 /DNA_END=390 /DNA_ORIENTATION=-